jgi:guanylate kinase
VGEFPHYDYLVVNDDLDRAVGELRAIVLAERARVSRRARLASAIAETFPVPPQEDVP